MSAVEMPNQSPSFHGESSYTEGFGNDISDLNNLRSVPTQLRKLSEEERRQLWNSLLSDDDTVVAEAIGKLPNLVVSDKKLIVQELTTFAFDTRLGANKPSTEGNTRENIEENKGIAIFKKLILAREIDFEDCQNISRYCEEESTKENLGDAAKDLDQRQVVACRLLEMISKDRENFIQPFVSRLLLSQYDDNPPKKWTQVENMFRLMVDRGNRQTIDSLLGILADRHSRLPVRLDAANILAKSPPAPDDRLIPTLLRFLDEMNEPLAAGMNKPDVVKEIEWRKTVLSLVANTLGKLGFNIDSVLALNNLTKNKDPYVVSSALFSLADIVSALPESHKGDPKYITLQQAVVKHVIAHTDNEDPMIRKAANNALANCPRSEEVVEAAIKNIGDPDPEVVFAASSSLAATAMGTNRNLKPSINSSFKFSQDLREKAIQAYNIAIKKAVDAEWDNETIRKLRHNRWIVEHYTDPLRF